MSVAPTLAHRGSKEGWLQKKKKATLLGGSAWKKGYWVLSGHQRSLKEYDAECTSDTQTPVFELDARKVESVVKETSVFLVITLRDSPGAKLTLKCSSEDECEDWIAAFEEQQGDLSKGSIMPKPVLTGESLDIVSREHGSSAAGSSSSIPVMSPMQGPRSPSGASAGSASPMTKHMSSRSMMPKVSSFRFSSSPLSPAGSTSPAKNSPSMKDVKKSFRLTTESPAASPMGSPKKSFFEKDMIDTELYMNKARSFAHSISRSTAESSRVKTGTNGGGSSTILGLAPEKTNSKYGRGLVLPSQTPEVVVDPARFVKSKNQQEMLLRVIQSELCHVGNLVLVDSPQSVLECMYSLTVEKGQKLIEQGELVEKLFVLEHGSVGVYSQDFATKPMELENVKDKAGEAFGILSVVYNQPGNFTCKTHSSSTFWVLSRQKLNEIAIRDARKRVAKKIHLLEKIPLIAENLERSLIDQLADSMQYEELKQNQIIIKKGEPLRKVLVVVDGVAEMVRSGGGKVRLRRGDIFGEWALLEGKKANISSVLSEADLVVRSPALTLLSLSVEEVEDLVGPLKVLVLKRWREHQSNENSERSLAVGQQNSTRSLALGQQNSTRSLDVPSPSPKHSVDVAEVEDDDEVIKRMTIAVKSRETTIRRRKSQLVPQTVPIVELKTLGTIASVQERKSEDDSEEDDDSQDDDASDEDEIAGATEDTNLDKPFDRSTPLRPELNLNSLKLCSLLGSGNFGTVHLALNEASDERFALKVIIGEFIVSHGWEYSIQNERDAMGEISRLNSPFLLKMFNCFGDDRNVYFVLELCEGGSLHQLVNQTSSMMISEDVARFYVGCVVLSLEHLHSREICFRDLKPENVMITDTGYCKLIDFGLAKKTLRTFTVCGSPDYTAPEVLQRIGHGMAVDFWALGVMLYELLCSNTPFCAYEPMDVYENILAHERPEDIVYPANVKLSFTVKSLIAELLHPQKNKRLGVKFPGIRGLKAHSYFDKFDWDSLEKLKMSPPLKTRSSVVGDVDASYQSNLDKSPVDKSGWTKKFGLS